MVVDWIASNKEWLFSGVLVTLPLAILTIWLGKKRKLTKSSSVEVEAGTDACQDVELERVDGVSMKSGDRSYQKLRLK